MLWSKRAFLLAACFPLAACFTPLYGEKLNGANTKAQMAQIEVTAIGGRAGIQLRNDLIFAFSGTGEAPQNPVYKLTVVVSLQSSLNVTDATAYRSLAESYLVNAIFTLVEIESKKEVLKGSAASSTSMDTSLQRYARDRGRIEATDRAYLGLTDQIVTQIATHFALK
jgi:LPS-assembly lipoprotein